MGQIEIELLAIQLNYWAKLIREMEDCYRIIKIPTGEYGEMES